MTNKKIRNDLILVLGIVIFAAVIFAICKIFPVLSSFNKGNPVSKDKFVKVIVDKEEKDCYNFNEDAEVKISNGENFNILVIKNGEAYIKSATCPDKICVHHKKISEVGDTIVCLPHKLVIKITEE